MYNIPENHIAVKVTACVYEKSGVNEAGEILWKSLPEKRDLFFTCDKDLVPWENKSSMKNQIVIPTIKKHKKIGCRFEYHSHEIIQKDTISIQEDADIAIKEYVDLRYYTDDLEDNMTQVRIQQNAINSIMKHFKLH